MAETYRFLVDTTKTTMTFFPNDHVIRDSTIDRVVAMCPITKGTEPICEGQFSFAPLILRRLNGYDDLVEVLREVESKFRVYTHDDQAVLNAVRAALAKVDAR